MKTKHKQYILAAALTAVLAITRAGFAQAPPAPDHAPIEAKPLNASENSAPAAQDPWRFDFAIMGWVALPSGNVTVRGHQVPVDVSVDQMLKHLDGIAMFGFELRKDKFGFYAQPNWIKLETDGNVGPLSAKDEMQIWIVDAAGFYQLAKWGEEKPVTLDVLAGVREMNLGNKVSIQGQRGIVDFNGSSSLNLIDPIVGMRSQIYLTRKFSLSLHGDVGGFDISNSSTDLSWQALGLLGYDFSRHFSLFVGYRALSVYRSTGSGSQDNGAALILHGAQLALNFHW